MLQMLRINHPISLCISPNLNIASKLYQQTLPAPESSAEVEILQSSNPLKGPLIDRYFWKKISYFNINNIHVEYARNLSYQTAPMWYYIVSARAPCTILHFVYVKRRAVPAQLPEGDLFLCTTLKN